MSRKKKALPIFENVTIADTAAEGKSIVRLTIPAHDGTEESQLVVFVPWCVPGDVVDLQIKRKKHSYAEAEVIRFRKYSDVRAVPMCQHFGVCGGCKWQNLPYSEQLKIKSKCTTNSLVSDICPCQNQERRKTVLNLSQFSVLSKRASIAINLTLEHLIVGISRERKSIVEWNTPGMR